MAPPGGLCPLVPVAATLLRATSDTYLGACHYHFRKMPYHHHVHRAESRMVESSYKFFTQSFILDLGLVCGEGSRNSVLDSKSQVCFTQAPSFFYPSTNQRKRSGVTLIFRMPWGSLVTSVCLPLMFKRDCALPCQLYSKQPTPPLGAQRKPCIQ